MEIVEKLKAWRAQTKVLVDMMESMHQMVVGDLKNKSLSRLAQVTHIMETWRATFLQWIQHMRKLFNHCNELPQLSIVAHHVTRKVKAMLVSIQREVVEKLSKSRLHH